MARYIDADKLIKDIENRRIVFKGTETIADILMTQGKAIRKAIENAPTADVEEVKHGEWIDTGDEILDTTYSGWKCSECGYIFCGDKFKFCPECGAKMDGGNANA